MNRILFSLAAAIGLTGGAAQAATLFGSEYGGGGGLFTLSTATGALTPVGPASSAIGDLTSDTRAGSFDLWGIDIAGEALVTLDETTGATTGTTAITNARGQITSIAFDPVTGVLYGNNTQSFGGGSGALFTIDTMTGVASYIGETGYSNIFALGFDQNGALFGIDDSTDTFLSIDTTTGAGTAIATLNFGYLFDMASDPETGTMYVSQSGGGNTLHEIDTGTGTLTAVGPFGAAENIAGLAFGAVSPVPIPGALPLLIGGLGALGALRRRRV